MNTHHFKNQLSARAFSLIEVVLAIGIFLVTVLALVGLLGPTLKSVDDVEQIDAVSSVVNTLNTFLQKSPSIAPSGSKFDVIYGAVASGNYATVFVFNAYMDATSPDTELKVGFYDESVGVDALVENADFSDAAGTIYRAVLSPSSVLPANERSPNRNGDGIYTLINPLASYPEGYFAMEVRIFAEDPPGPSASFQASTNLSALSNVEPIFTYNTAVVR
ncbi:MAG: hypothetical protein CL815_01430 [Coraliomargarita sp.]|nr:hypothetical protein [Coraliomargarita sp.]